MTAIILAGALAGLGLAVVVAWLVPAHPDLAGALDRLDPSRTPAAAVPSADPGADLTDRLGVWIQRRLPTTWARTPTADLAVLGIPAARYLGQRAAFFLVGLVFPALFVALVTAFGWQLPFTVPVLAGIVLGTGLSLLPAYNAKSDAAVAREEFTRAVGAFTDLTALERQAGAGTTQALESAAAVGDSWVFVRIREELAHARWAGKPPWDALSELGAALQVPGLADLGDIMRMSGEQGVAVYDSLRARAASNREAVLAADHARANRASEALTMPTAALGIIFLGLLATPAVIRIALG